jgi:hypothetical protein
MNDISVRVLSDNDWQALPRRALGRTAGIPKEFSPYTRFADEFYRCLEPVAGDEAPATTRSVGAERLVDDGPTNEELPSTHLFLVLAWHTERCHRKHVEAIRRYGLCAVGASAEVAGIEARQRSLHLAKRDGGGSPQRHGHSVMAELRVRRDLAVQDGDLLSPKMPFLMKPVAPHV